MCATADLKGRRASIHKSGSDSPLPAYPEVSLFGVVCMQMWQSQISQALS